LKNERSKNIFLLGGRDLEMETIRRGLEESGYVEGETLFDKKLAWGAKLSAYADILAAHADADAIYGIELAEDIKPPKNYRRIDHHNDYAGKEASLLQVLKLLGREPTREEMLVAANDTGHIEGMKAVCATAEEIEAIRKKERQLQGITEEDEACAKEEIAKGKERGRLFCIESTLETYTAISDFCDRRPLLVYGRGGVLFLGTEDQVQALSKAYAKEVDEHHAFYGRGYFGVDKAYFQTLEKARRNALVEQMAHTVESAAPSVMSYHAFMFPFRFERVGKTLFEERIAIDSSFYPKSKRPSQRKTRQNFEERIAIDSSFYSRLHAAGWEYVPFRVDEKAILYNEYSYFTEPVRKTLYNTNETFQEGESAYFFTKTLDEEAAYSIEIREGTSTKCYTLKLTDLSLRLFETGIGILVFETENHTYTDFKDVLKINEYGRRVYPQFLDGEYYTSCAAKGAFLAERITVYNGEKWCVEERFLDPYERGVPSGIHIGGHIMKTLGEMLFSQEETGFCRIAPALDDRMFVVSYAENEGLMNLLKRDEKNFLKNDDWYRYLFVDGNYKTVQYRPMQEDLLQKATYPRWLGWGTLWGISRYSLVALSTPEGRGLILPHAQYQYHQMAILILANYASLARFSDEVSEISETLGKNGAHEVAEEVASLYRYYIKFINNLHFREITFQDQGIEMYDIAKKQLGFDREVAQLDNEIAELHTYLEMGQEKERNRELDKITKIGAIFLPPSVMSGILGINSENFMHTDCAANISLTAIFLSALIGWFMVWERPPKAFRMAVALIGFLVLIFGTPYLLKADAANDSITTQVLQKLPLCHLNTKEDK